MGADTGKKVQWEFPNVELTALEKRKVLANVLKIAVLTMFGTHIYTFDNRYYLQQRGGPIGLRATCAVARLTMVEWDKLWVELLTKMGLTLEEAARYMDDLRAFMYSIKKGWRWESGELCWREEWEEEDSQSGKSDLERTCEILKESMNMIFEFLEFTIESEIDFEDSRLPTLDLKLWISPDNLVLYTLFE